MRYAGRVPRWDAVKAEREERAMPRENVYAESTPDGERGVQVQWYPMQRTPESHPSASGHVTVGAGNLTRDGLDAASDNLPDSYTAPQFADLDRDGINRLIRALRRARNSAFGSDE